MAMGEKVMMNKNALEALKQELKAYQTALPVFEMKEEQLKEAVQTVEASLLELQLAIQETDEKVSLWVGVMAEEHTDISQLACVKEVITTQQEIMGVPVLVFQEIKFQEPDMDLYNTPLWLDAAEEVLLDQKTKHTLMAIEEKNLELLQRELSEARRMKNALKEVFIPEAKAGIRRIEIYLGDVERLAIGCAKLVKKKKEQKTKEL